MTKPKIIITADDYGPMPAINEGINALVALGRVNSVNVLINFAGAGEYASSAQNVGPLLEAARTRQKVDPNFKLDIGCHFTITSGKPMSSQIHLPENAKLKGYLTDSKGNFKAYTEMRRAQVAERDAMKQLISHELKAQHDALTEAIKEHSLQGESHEIAYFNSHHNALTLWPEYFEAQLELAQQSAPVIPLRTPNVYPTNKGNNYLKMISFRMHEDLSKPDRSKIINYNRELVSGIFSFDPRHENRHPSPHYLESRMYGPAIPKRPVFIHKNRVRQKFKRLNEALSYLKHQSNDTVGELLLHVAHSGQEHWMKTIGYPGINHTYIEGRKAEFDAIRKFSDFDQWQVVPWSSLL